MNGNTESFEKIFDALNNLYKKTDDVLFEVETVATEIREMLKKESAAILAEEALADERNNAQEAVRAKEVNEGPVPIGETGLPEPELDIW